MKVAFWSYTGEPCGVTANLAAISVVGVTGYPYTVMTVENHLSGNNLGHAYCGTSRMDYLREKGNYFFEGGGIEGLLRRIYRGDCKPSDIRAYTNEIINKHLYYIPQGKVIHNELFDYEFHSNAPALFKLIENYADLCFIDTAGHNSFSSNIILEAADLIVINLNQKNLYFEELLHNNPGLISKAIFIVNTCNNHSSFTSRRIAKLYNIPADSITEIPYNEMYSNAYVKGSVVEFILGSYYCTKDNPNYQFIRAIKRAYYLIIKKAGYLSEAYDKKQANAH